MRVVDYARGETAAPKHRKVQMPWREQDIAAVRQMWNSEGLSAGEIGARTGRGRNSICGMINRHRELFDSRDGKPLKKPKAKTKAAKRHPRERGEIDRLAGLWSEGLSGAEMAEATGRSLAFVKGVIRDNRALFPHRLPPRGGGAVRSPSRGVALGPPSLKSTSSICPAAPVAAEPARGEVAAAPDPAHAVTLMQRRDGQCHFPLWDHYGAKPDAESLYYGAPIGGAGVYCPHHRRIAYTTPQARERAAPKRLSRNFFLMTARG